MTETLDWRSSLESLIGAYSNETLRAYTGDFNCFETWCLENDKPCLPAAPETLVEFISSQADRYKYATISRRITAIARIHRLCGQDDPISTELVRLEMRRLRRRLSARQDQALGLTKVLKDRLIDACPTDTTGLRDKALISLGYDTLCRRAELVSLRIEDLTVNDDGTADILVRKAKNDPYGHGRLAYVSPTTLSMLRKWFRESGVGSQGPIFLSPHDKGNKETPIDVSTVNRIIKKRATKARLSKGQIEGLSGHSMRIGAAQDMAAAGIDLTSIMHSGGWKSPNIVMRYVENMDIQKSGMARLYKLP